MNRAALTALTDIRVLDHQDRQHRPVFATFAWDRVLQEGTILQRAAKLNLQVHDASDPGCPVNSLGEQLWRAYDHDFSCTIDADAMWDTYNQYAVQLLLLNGASWEKGPHFRGKLPQFQKVQASSPQEASGSLASPRLGLLRAILRSLRELELRLARNFTGDGDIRTLRNTQHRLLLRRLKVAKLVPFAVNRILDHDVPHLVELTLTAIQREVKHMKFAAIKKWKSAMKMATTSMAIGKIVYQYLKRKGKVVPPNLSSMIPRLPWTLLQTDGTPSLLSMPIMPMKCRF